MKFRFALLGLVGLCLAGCGVDPRWGPPGPSNASFPGSPGVDFRWGDRRNGLRDPLQWQYESMGDEE